QKLGAKMRLRGRSQQFGGVVAQQGRVGRFISKKLYLCLVQRRYQRRQVAQAMFIYKQAIHASVAARSGGSSVTAARGTPCCASTGPATASSAALEAAASEPPLSRQALPVFRHSARLSKVTLGRAS
nr:hypothetical protein [Tanacetum cinerariifolium]